MSILDQMTLNECIRLREAVGRLVVCAARDRAKAAEDALDDFSFRCARATESGGVPSSSSQLTTATAPAVFRIPVVRSLQYCTVHALRNGEDGNWERRTSISRGR